MHPDYYNWNCPNTLINTICDSIYCHLLPNLTFLSKMLKEQCIVMVGVVKLLAPPTLPGMCMPISKVELTSVERRR